MIPQRWIEAYLRLLLKHRWSVVVGIFVCTAFFAVSLTRMRLHTDFFDFYPKFRTFSDALAACRNTRESTLANCIVRAAVRPGPDPHMKIYTDFRRMFGSANILSVILEVKHGDIYNPATLQKLDRITKYIIYSKGVIPYQILSLSHPAVRQATAGSGAIRLRPVFDGSVPQTQGEAERVRFASYAAPGVRGVFAARDDSAAVVHAGFWEEGVDFEELWERMTALKVQEDDADHTLYITGFPWLYASVLRYAGQIPLVFAATVATLAFLLFVYFRTWTGIWVPILSGVLSSVWGLGIAVVLGFNFDPLVLVIPIFLTARALSHSVQSMDRYHEAFYVLGDKREAILHSYSRLFPPAIASIVTDGLGLLIVAVTPIPLIQKVAIFASFWVVSIFVSVVTLHPIILSLIRPPGLRRAADRGRRLPLRLGLLSGVSGVVLAATLNAVGVFPAWAPMLAALAAVAGFWWYHAEDIYPALTGIVIRASQGYRRWVVIGSTIVLFVVGWSYGRTLQVGDLTPGGALLFPDHPYNVAYEKLDTKFVGASQLIVIADTQRLGGIKEPDTLALIDEFAGAMAGAPGAEASVSLADIVKQMNRLLHDGDPKWGLIPATSRDLAQFVGVFAILLGNTDRFVDGSARYATVTTLFRGHSHAMITKAIAHAKRAARETARDTVKFEFAGGLLGILAAVNRAVENSYWTSLVLIFAVVYLCLCLTYGSWLAAGILMIPVVLSQVMAEALMVKLHIDLNVNSLPIAAAGVGVGVDYGIYHFSRILDVYDEIGTLDEAVDRATATAGKAIIFTATTMIASTIFWFFSDLKFQAEMGLLLATLMAFNTLGGLVVVPAFVKVVRPTFLLDRTSGASRA